MSIWSWLTGHDPKESDVYANFDKVEQVTSDFHKISTSTVSSAQENVNAAVQKLNSVKGLAQYVGTIPAGSYDSVFSSISSSIDTLSKGLSDKADSIKVYSESSIFEKIGSGITMGIFKAGEGILSVGESLIDGAASIVGWVAGAAGNKDFQNDIANFIKSDLSHGAFDFYYKSDFAKKSLFTEDSAVAGASKIVGKTVGYLYAGGVLAGMGSSMGIGNTAIGHFAKGLASTSTWGATAAGALGGLGSGVESGLKSGLQYNDAMTQGVIQGGIQAGLAFLGGKLGEKVAKSHDMKNATDEAAKAAIKAKKLSEYEGYSDVFSRAGRQFGSAQMETLKAGTKALGASIKSIHGSEAAKDAALTAQTAFMNEGRNLIYTANPVAQVINGVSGHGAAAVAATSAVGGNAGAIAEGASSAARHSIAASVGNTLRSAAFPGVAAATGEALISTKMESIGDAVAVKPEIVRSVTSGELSKYLNSVVPRAEAVLDGNPPQVIYGPAPSFVTPTYEPSITSEVPITPTYDVPPAASVPVQVLYGPGPQYTPTTPPVQVLYGPGPQTQTPTQTQTEVQVLYAAPPAITPTVTYEWPTISWEQTYSWPPTQITPTYDWPTWATYTVYTPYTYTSINPGPGIITYSQVAPITYEPIKDTKHSGNSFVPINGFANGGSKKSISDELLNADKLQELDELDELEIGTEEKIDKEALKDIISSSKFTKIPTATTPTSTKKKGSNSVIPIATGLSAAAAAALGAKAYLDSKNKRDDDEEDDESFESEDDDFETDEWTDDGDTVDVEFDSNDMADYQEENNSDEVTDDYYQDYEGSYTARNHDELADLE